MFGVGVTGGGVEAVRCNEVSRRRGDNNNDDMDVDVDVGVDVDVDDNDDVNGDNIAKEVAARSRARTFDSAFVASG
ncbi:hypothetical protein HZH68_008254 [Vespula germanica]|uniref:Uncharacterized protein n=1 Tax=Vespula germanica TaxID=30212 RepID=A0A834N824_VESGE|nr:hypothetical protein HZH68_008254 [Vespula germanica]